MLALVFLILRSAGGAPAMQNPQVALSAQYRFPADYSNNIGRFGMVWDAGSAAA